jgi:hypothetical protein
MLRRIRIASVVLALAAVGGLTTLRARAQTTTFFRLSSGPFALPAAGRSVDWVVTNTSAAPHAIRVTVFRHGIGVPRAVVAPGPITVTVPAFQTTHNANSIGTVFLRGSTYEVVVETDSRSMLPIVHVWEDLGNTVLPGTLIPSGSWVRLP